MGGLNTKVISFQLNLGATGIDMDEAGNKQISVYPVPASDYINISLPDESYRVIRIIDINGKTVLQQNIISSFAKINVASLPNGIYIVLSQNDKGIIKAKFNKE